jgi:hypothetical protein
MTVVAVAGTWAWKSAWWKDDSAFWRHMERYCLYPARVDGKAFKWSTDLGNTWNPFKKRRSDWEACGHALGYYMTALQTPPQHRVVLAHSHGGQGVAMACADGLKIDRLVTVGTPVRADMDEIWKKARPNIRHWCHVLDSKSDRTAWWGAFGDRKLGVQRHFELADANVKIAGIGHSGLFHEDHFHWWACAGLVDQLRGW